MGARHFPLPFRRGCRSFSSWIHSTIFFTLLSYQILIPGGLIVLQSGSGNSASLSSASSPVSRIILVRDPSEDVELSDNLFSRFNIPPGNLSQKQRSPYWEAVYFLKYGAIPPARLYNKTSIISKGQTMARTLNGLGNKLSMPTIKGGKYRYNVGNDIDTEGVFTNRYSGGRRSLSFYPVDMDEYETPQDYLGPTFGLMPPDEDSFQNPQSDEMISNYIPALEPQSRPISPSFYYQAYRFPFPLYQIRQGFNRKPRADLVREEDLNKEEAPEQDQQEKDGIVEHFKIFGKDWKHDSSSSGESDTGESKAADKRAGPLKVWAKPDDVQQLPKPQLPQVYGQFSIPGDPRKHYNPFQLLRKFLVEQDSSVLSKNGRSNSHQNFPQVSASTSGLGNVFLKNLVSRSSGSGGGSGRGEDESLGDDGDPGPRGAEGRKFQTQGW